MELLKTYLRQLEIASNASKVYLDYGNLCITSKRGAFACCNKGENCKENTVIKVGFAGLKMQVFPPIPLFPYSTFYLTESTVIKASARYFVSYSNSKNAPSTVKEDTLSNYSAISSNAKDALSYDQNMSFYMLNMPLPVLSMSFSTVGVSFSTVGVPFSLVEVSSSSLEEAFLMKNKLNQKESKPLYFHPLYTINYNAKTGKKIILI